MKHFSEMYPDDSHRLGNIQPESTIADEPFTVEGFTTETRYGESWPCIQTDRGLVQITADVDGYDPDGDNSGWIGTTAKVISDAGTWRLVEA